mgnify:FL=1
MHRDLVAMLGVQDGEKPVRQWLRRRAQVALLLLAYVTLSNLLATREGRMIVWL